MVRRALAAALVAAALVSCAAPPHRAERARPDHRRVPTASPTQTHRPPADAGGLRAAAKGPLSTGWRVSRVVDGDTVVVSRRGRDLTLRLIGIDTPETVHPTEPIECFGPEASRFASRQLLGRDVALEFDRSQGRVDYYDRTLAYVWVTGPTPQLFNRTAVRRGYALEYTYDTAYAWQREFQHAEQQARSERLGVWRCPNPGD